MKQIKIFLIATLILFFCLFVSCATNGKKEKQDNHKIANPFSLEENETNESDENADKIEELNEIEHSNETEEVQDNKKNSDLQTEKSVVEKSIINEKIEPAININIEIEEIPEATTKKSSFKTPYKIRITDKNTMLPASDIPVAIIYPSKKNISNQISYDTVIKRSDLNGKINFYPNTPQIAIKGNIDFYPLPNSIDEKLIKTIDFTKLENKARAQFNIKTDFLAKGGYITLLEFNESNQLIENKYDTSNALLLALYKKGFSNIKVAPEYAKEVLGDNTKSVYDYERKNFTRISFFIYGAVSISEISSNDETVEENILKCALNCLDLRNGKIIYQKEYTSNGIANLSEIIAEDLFWNL